jgi:primosomal protein N' (replication factor Y)
LEKYAQVIIDISRRGLDRPFCYRIPEELQQSVRAGSIVMVPFGAGNTLRKGYVVGFADRAEVAADKLKEIAQTVEPGRGYTMEDDSEFYLRLAAWMKNRYGSTMATAMRTVLASRKQGKVREHRQIRLLLSKEEGEEQLALYLKKHQTARARLLKELLQVPELPWTLVTTRLHISSDAVNAMKRAGVIEVVAVQELRNPVNVSPSAQTGMRLSAAQQQIVDTVVADFDRLQSVRSGAAAGDDPGEGPKGISEEAPAETLEEAPAETPGEASGGKLPFVSLIHGVTGSGKTEVYISIIKEICARGRQAIMLIPEISLTFQTLMRFYSHFGDRVSVVNSSLSEAERTDQWERARRGEIDVIIGPRSALFTPFSSPGVIVIDEEHERSYKNESMPKYQTREVAEEIAKMHGAVLVLGSATPSLESYWRAQHGEIRLFRLRERLTGGRLPSVETVDMREELKQGNKSMLSRSLHAKIEDRLRKGQQSMLFINRRGFAGFVSCRSCGFVAKCPHCDISLSLHGNGRLVCHYCGYERPSFRTCPECGSRYVVAMRAGTEKIEEFLRETFPQARILRMDADTTRRKGSYEKILSAFSSEEADILLGTQMIVKGHDFPAVTLVGILMADLSLYGDDYRSAERTFQLLTQAAGRAGRGAEAGDVVIQTYQPEHYAIRYAAKQDYEGFYGEETAYRRLLRYPPAAHMMAVQIQSEEEEEALRAANVLRMRLMEMQNRRGAAQFQIIGPSTASVKKLRDLFRFVLYIKAEKYDTLVVCKDMIEKTEAQERRASSTLFRHVEIQFDFDPINPF